MVKARLRTGVKPKFKSTEEKVKWMEERSRETLAYWAAHPEEEPPNYHLVDKFDYLQSGTTGTYTGEIKRPGPDYRYKPIMDAYTREQLIEMKKNSGL